MNQYYKETENGMISISYDEYMQMAVNANYDYKKYDSPKYKVIDCSKIEDTNEKDIIPKSFVKYTVSKIENNKY